MKTLLLLTSLMILSSCTKPTVDYIDVNVDKQSTYNVNHLSFVINASYEGEFGVNYEDFVLEIVVKAAPPTDVSNEEAWLESVSRPTLTQTIILTQDSFIAIQGKMIHCLGYKFDAVTPSDKQSEYVLSYVQLLK